MLKHVHDCTEMSGTDEVFEKKNKNARNKTILNNQRWGKYEAKN